MKPQSAHRLILVILGLLQAAVDSRTQTIMPEIRNVTASGGDDVLLECRQTAGAILVSWRKDDTVVEATDTYRDGRIYMAKNEGMLILNSELWDRGQYSCMIVHIDRIITHRIWLDIAPPTDTDVHSNSAFQCGYPRVRGKVVGGKVSNEGQSPWTALLWNNIQNTPFCGGVLLNRRWIVTAAHCFTHSGLSKDEIDIRLGEHDTQTVVGYERTFRGEEIIKHPNFNEQTYDSDIALIKLQQPVTYTDYIIPLCLPSELRAEELLQADRRGFVTGWGNTEEQGDYSRVLRRVRLTIVSQQACGNSHSVSDIITNNMFCADAGRKSASRDACQGDSGGPFVTKDNNRWYLLGLVSWGVGCARPDLPGVYTRVHRFRQWIMDLVQQDMQTCEESSFELGEELRASRKEANNLRLLNQESQGEIEELEQELLRMRGEVFELQERIHTSNCVNTTSTTPTTQPHVPTSTTSPPITEPRPVTTRSPLREVAVPCRQNMCWHVNPMARCLGGLCICDMPDYSRLACLPVVESCHIYQNNPYALGQATFRGDDRTDNTYACEGDPTSTIHAISVYEGPVHTRPPTPGDVRVRVTGGDQGPLTLIFSSYEPVRWLVSVDPGITIELFVLVGYYLDQCSVELTSPTQSNVSVVSISRAPRGFGADGGGGHTAEFLRYVANAYGEVGSFSGTYRADSWVLTLPGSPPLIEPIRFPVPMARVDSAQVSHAHWTPFAFRYDGSFCACQGGDQYVRLLTGGGGGENEVDYHVTYVGVVLCQSPARYKIFLANDLRENFLNIGDTHGRGHDHCEFVGARFANQSQTLTANDWYNVPIRQGYYRGFWGEGVSYGDIGGGFASFTGRIMVSWYECGISIP